MTRLEPAGTRRILLLGPGRWGTSTVSLGVPVSFAEIQRVSAVCEIVKARHERRAGRLARLALLQRPRRGEHALPRASTRSGPGYRLGEALLRAAPNRLAELLPDDARLAEVVRVIDFPLPDDARALWLNADCVRQEALCYLGAPAAERPAAG